MTDSLRARRNADLTEVLKGVPDTPHPEDPPDNTRRWLAALFAVVLLVGVGVGYLALTGNAAKDQTQATAAQAVKAADPVLELCAGNDVVARALQAKGACGAAAQVRAEPIPGAPGAAGAPGKDGAPGAPGIPGRDGTSPACLAEPTACRGTDGAPGQPGTAGTPGTPGADGAAGQPGQDGQPGKDGTAGAAGKPPAGFTFTDGVGRVQTCTRDTGSPDDAATYTCTSSTGPTSMRLTSLQTGA